MNPTITKALKHYFFGMLAVMWNAGWNAVGGILGIDGAAATGISDKLHILTVHECAAAFLGAAVIHGVIWIKSHPIPETLPNTNPPMPPSA